MKHSILYAATLVFAFTFAAHADIMIGTVSASYSTQSADNTELTISNTTTFAFTNVVLSGTGTSGTINGVTGSKNLVNVAGSSSTFYVFDTTSSSGSASVFHSDFDDTFSGAVTYTLSFNWNGSAVTATFSPDTNATGGFLGFLGNNAAGNESDPSISSTVVANLSSSVPEPAAIQLMLLMLAGTGALCKFRRS